MKPLSVVDIWIPTCGSVSSGIRAVSSYEGVELLHFCDRCEGQKHVDGNMGCIKSFGGNKARSTFFFIFPSS